MHPQEQIESSAAPANAILEILNRLNKKEFHIDLSCPECGGLIEDFLCPKCVVSVDKSGVKISGAMLFVSTLLSWGIPLFGAGLGYLIAHNFVGLVCGFVITFGGAAMMREMDRIGHQAAKADIAADLLLAKKYQKNPSSWDAAAFCYLHWIRTQKFPLPPRDMTAFLWQYRFARNTNKELRRAFFDALFYAMCRVVDHYGANRSAAQANLLLAVADDSAMQVEIGKTLTLLSSSAAALRDILRTSAPLTAAALSGGPEVSAADALERDPVPVRCCGNVWPSRLREFDITPEESKRLRFIYQNGDRLVGVSSDGILAGTIDRSAEKVKVQFSESLENVSRVAEEWVADRSEYIGVWLFADDHAYGFNGIADLPAVFEVAGIRLKNAVAAQVPTPRNDALFWIGKGGAMLCLAAMGVGLLMLIAGGGAVNQKGSPAYYGLPVVTLPLFLLMFFLPTWGAGRRGNTKAFLAACGCRGVRNLADSATKLSQSFV